MLRVVFAGIWYIQTVWFLQRLLPYSNYEKLLYSLNPQINNTKNSYLFSHTLIRHLVYILSFPTYYTFYIKEFIYSAAIYNWLNNISAIFDHAIVCV